MACSPTPETPPHPRTEMIVAHSLACIRRLPKSGRRGGEPFAHHGMESRTGGGGAASPSVTVGVVIPAAFTISARGAVVVFARKKLDRATARRVPRYGVALLGELLLHRRSRFGHGGADGTESDRPDRRRRPAYHALTVSNDVDFFPGIKLKWGFGHMITAQSVPEGRGAGSLTGAKRIKSTEASK